MNGVTSPDVAKPGTPSRAEDHGLGVEAVAVQFRYAFVIDDEGLKVLDVTVPSAPRVIPGAVMPLAGARGLNLARTYAYLAAGPGGLVLVDIERPEKPRLEQAFTAGGTIGDARDVKIGMTNGSVFAYVADGTNGLRVIQLVSANDTAGAYGFKPAADADSRGHVPDARDRPSPFRVASTATAQWTRPATSSPSSEGGARAPSTFPSSSACISGTARSTR